MTASSNRFGAAQAFGLLPAWANRMAFAGLLGAIFLAPLPLGSNRPWAMALLAIVIWASLLVALGSFAGGSRWPAGLRRARWPLAMTGSFCALVAVQLYWPPIAVLGPQTGPATLSAWHTNLYLLRSLTCFGAMVLALLTVTTRSRCITLLGVVLGVGLCQAGLGIVLSRSGMPYEYLFLAFEPFARVSGTFANANHFAGYMSLSMAAGIGLLIAQYGGHRHRADDWRSRLTAFLQFALSLKMILRLALMLLVIALVLSYSRMGNVAFFLALVGAGLVLAIRSREMRRTAIVLVSTMLIIDLLVLGQWIGFDRIANRFQDTSVMMQARPGSPLPSATNTEVSGSLGIGTTAIPREESVEERLQVPLLAAKLALQKPWFGQGGGTFHLAFAPVKPEWVFVGHWTNAHNDFAEVAVEVGLVGLALWVGIGIVSTYKGVRLVSDRQPRLNRGVGIATLVAIIATALQSFMDFGLQIPANALNFSLLLTMSWLVGGLPPDVRRLPSAPEYSL